MAGTGFMGFSMADMYPDMAGYYTTRTTTVPSAQEQNTLVDSEESANQVGITATPVQHKNIFLLIIGAVVVMAFLGMKL